MFEYFMDLMPKINDPVPRLYPDQRQQKSFLWFSSKRPLKLSDAAQISIY
jgi:hypothetical protein